MITLEDLLFITNDSTMIHLVNSDTQEQLTTEPFPADESWRYERYLDKVVMDIVVGEYIMYIDLEIEEG